MRCPYQKNLLNLPNHHYSSRMGSEKIFRVKFVEDMKSKTAKEKEEVSELEIK